MSKPFFKYSVLIAIFLAGSGADYFTKKWAMASLPGRPPVRLIEGFIECAYTENRGMVFGILNDADRKSMHPVLKYNTLAGAVLLLLFIVFNRKKGFSRLLPFSLLLTGAAGNSFDKLKYGFVVDFIHIHAGNVFDWPFYFNIADAMIVAGMVLLAFMVISGKDDIISGSFPSFKTADRD